MKIKYEVKGMSCGGCVSNVRKALMLLPGVTDAEVQLNPQIAVITMSNSIAIEVLQSQLTTAGHYTIKEVLNN